MRWIYTGGVVILLLCMVLLGGCAAGNKTTEESTAPHIMQPSQSEEVDITPPDTEDITYEYYTSALFLLGICFNEPALGASLEHDDGAGKKAA